MSFEEQFPELKKCEWTEIRPSVIMYREDDIYKNCLSRQRVKESIENLRNYFQKEYNKIPQNKTEEEFFIEIELLGKIRVLDKLLEELKL